MQSVEKDNLVSISSCGAKKGKGLLNWPWPNVVVRLYKRKNAMNPHLTNGRIMDLLLDYTESSVWSTQ